jgi:hypothetical protein
MERWICGQSIPDAGLGSDMQKTESSLQEPVPIPQMHPHEAVPFQRSASRALGVAAAVQAEGQESPEAPTAYRTGEGGTGYGRRGSTGRRSSGAIDFVGSQVGRFDPAQQPVKIIKQQNYSPTPLF